MQKQNLHSVFRLFLLYCFQCFAAVAINSNTSYGQCEGVSSANCQAVPSSEMMLSTESSLSFAFTDFKDYTAGQTINGASRLRLKVEPNNALCKWSLRVYIENNPAAGTALSDWETLFNYGNQTSIPSLDLLELRVYNGCGTPISSGVYQKFQPVNGAYIDIINDSDLTIPGTCTTNVNGAGSYVTNYNEFTFNIDYRIVPGLSWSAGIYQLNLHFCLVEQP